jgi:hypothetical protein
MWRWPLMIDNPEKTARLLAALKEAVPFKVELTERLIKHLRGQHDAVAEQAEHIVSDLSYAGDEVASCVIWSALKDEKHSWSP